MKIALLIFFSIITLHAQDTTQSEWKPMEETAVPMRLLRSTWVMSIPTAEGIPKGDIVYAIEHRFRQEFNTGFENLWGLDGGVVMRMMLGYAFTDDLFVSFSRSNNFGQYELETKYRFLEVKSDVLPLMFAAKVGGAYNSKGLPKELEDSKKYQFYGSLIANTMLFEKLGIGVVPTYLNNSNCECQETQNSLVLGTYAQYYFNDMTSVFFEYSPTLNGWRNKYDTYGLGVELETGGHFFKLYMTNNINLNTTQVLAGAASKPILENFHFGFAISRNL